MDLADSTANDEHFGRPGVMKGERSAFPQARLVALAECGTHAIFDAVAGPYTTSENALSRELFGRLTKGMLCLADRGFYSFEAWQQASQTGADLLWRVKSNLGLGSTRDLPDGSWLAEVFHSTEDTKRVRPVTVRVIEYTIDDGRDPTGSYRLITTILDHRKAPARDLAAAELLARLLPPRRPRTNPRVVKRKYTKWHVKREHHCSWPQPDRPPDQAVRISN